MREKEAKLSHLRRDIISLMTVWRSQDAINRRRLVATDENIPATDLLSGSIVVAAATEKSFRRKVPYTHTHTNVECTSVKII